MRHDVAAPGPVCGTDQTQGQTQMQMCKMQSAQ